MTRNPGTPWGDHDDEMRARLLDDELETALSGDPSAVTGEWAVVAEVAAELRQAAAEEPPPPSAALAAALVDPSTVMSPARRPAPARTGSWWSRLSVRGRSILAGATALASVGGAGVAGALPGPLQDGVARVVEAVTPFDLPDSTDHEDRADSDADVSDEGDVGPAAPQDRRGEGPRGEATDAPADGVTDVGTPTERDEPADAEDRQDPSPSVSRQDDSEPEAVAPPATDDRPDEPVSSPRDDPETELDSEEPDTSDAPTSDADEPAEEPSTDDAESASPSESESDDSEEEGPEPSEEPTRTTEGTPADDPDVEEEPDDEASELRDLEEIDEDD